MRPAGSTLGMRLLWPGACRPSFDALPEVCFVRPCICTSKRHAYSKDTNRVRSALKRVIKNIATIGKHMNFNDLTSLRNCCLSNTHANV